MIDLDSVHADLGYTPEEAAELKKIRLVWKKLENLRQRAHKDRTALTQYRDLLEKSLRQVRAAKPSQDWEREYEAWLAWRDSVEREHGLSEIETNRGMPYLAWSEKWLPNYYSAYVHAIAQVCDEPSARHLEAARLAFSNLVKAYIEAIPKR